jgi:hypothetical protein
VNSCPRATPLGIALAFALAGMGSLAGCKKKVGDTCSPNQMACIDKTQALLCVNGKFALLGCRGGDGCKATGGEVACDNRVASEGDGCRDDDLACTGDKARELSCKDHKFVVTSTCRGPNVCAFKGTTLYCDSDLAESGDPCEYDGNLSCSVDKKSELRCKGGEFIVENSCKGPKGCSITEATLHCDDNLADLNDPCKKEGDLACSMDKKSLYVCTGSRFRQKDLCPKRGCTYAERGNEVNFDCH